MSNLNLKPSSEFYGVLRHFEKYMKNSYPKCLVERETNTVKRDAGIFYRYGFVNNLFRAFLVGHHFKLSSVKPKLKPKTLTEIVQFSHIRGHIKRAKEQALRYGLDYKEVTKGLKTG